MTSFGLDVDLYEDIYIATQCTFTIPITVNNWTTTDYDIVYAKYHLPTQSVKWS